MAKGTCTVDGCGGMHCARGWCRKHYQQQAKRGLPPLSKTLMADRTCSINGCDAWAHCRDWCRKHYERWRVHGDPNYVRPKPDPLCSVSGCGRPHDARGLCRHHYDAERKAADPLKGRRYYEANREKRAEARRLYYEENREKCLDLVREWHRRNPEHARDKARARRAAKMGRNSEHFKATDVFERDGWQCQICGRAIPRDIKYPHPQSASLDHIIPLARGGDHTRKNTQAAHLRCNTVKHDTGPGQLRLIG